MPPKKKQKVDNQVKLTFAQKQKIQRAEKLQEKINVFMSQNAAYDQIMFANGMSNSITKLDTFNATKDQVKKDIAKYNKRPKESQIVSRDMFIKNHDSLMTDEQRQRLSDAHPDEWKSMKEQLKSEMKLDLGDLAEHRLYKSFVDKNSALFEGWKEFANVNIGNPGKAKVTMEKTKDVKDIHNTGMGKQYWYNFEGFDDSFINHRKKTLMKEKDES